MLRESPQLRDGRWLFVPILNEADAKDVEQLVLVKMRPTRRHRVGSKQACADGPSRFLE